MIFTASNTTGRVTAVLLGVNETYTAIARQRPFQGYIRLKLDLQTAEFALGTLFLHFPPPPPLPTQKSTNLGGVFCGFLVTAHRTELQVSLDTNAHVLQLLPHYVLRHVCLRS
jgi:hypothetical protein